MKSSKKNLSGFKNLSGLYHSQIFAGAGLQPAPSFFPLKSVLYLIPSPIHRHIIRFLIDASNNSIGFTYGYLRFTPSGLGIDVDVSPRRG